MTSTYRQSSLQPVDLEGINKGGDLSLRSLLLAIGLLFFGMMLTLGVTLSLAGQVVDPLAAGKDPGILTLDSAVQQIVTERAART